MPNHLPNQPELLAPAGNFAAGCAALHYGADAVYLGLKKFSARADADNFSIAELAEFTAYAHSLMPRRRVYVTLNTLLQERELPAARKMLEQLTYARADAVIAQDFGVINLCRRDFPELPIHISTQLTVHNIATAQFLANLGVKRITLARELTLAEIAATAQSVKCEIEFFLHGALCYSYSGLCLFSSHLHGRSANRGRCRYPCRELFAAESSAHSANTTAIPPATGHFFSMKDLSLAENIDPLIVAGVHSLKIEGRKKSSLYVAAVVNFYRQLLAGKLTDPTDRQNAARDWQSVFSRETCTEFIANQNRRTVINSQFVGHRGAAIGKIEKIVSRHPAENFLIFTAAAPVECHDGLQFIIDGETRPYGFAVKELFVIRQSRWQKTFAACANDQIAVALPTAAPFLPPGAPVYHAASQSLKRRYHFPLPRPHTYRNLWLITISLTINSEKIHAAIAFAKTASAATAERGALIPPPLNDYTAEQSIAGNFTPTEKDLPRTIADAFNKTAEYPFAIAELTITNPQSLFAPASKLNQLRRALYADLWRQCVNYLQLEN